MTRLASFQVKGHEQIKTGIVLDDHRMLDLNAAYAHYLREVEKETTADTIADAQMPVDMLRLLDGGRKTLDRVKRTIDYVADLTAKRHDVRGQKLVYDLPDVQLRAPIPRPRGMGIGYFNARGIIEEASRAHQDDRSVGLKMAIEYPKYATITWSHPRCVIGPDDPIIFPKMSKTIFNSIELGLVIGKEAYQVPPEKAHEYIVGYTVTTDITAFDLVQTENAVYTLCRCKSMPSFWPTGPWIVLAEAMPDVHHLNAIVRMNGKEAMKTNSNLYIFDPFDYVSDVSQYMILEVGTVIGMGAFCETTYTLPKVGDVVENEIEGIGTLRNPVISEDEARRRSLLP